MFADFVAAAVGLAAAVTFVATVVAVVVVVLALCHLIPSLLCSLATPSDNNPYCMYSVRQE